MRSIICAIALAAANLTAGAQVQSGVRLGGPLGDSTELALIAQLKALYPDSSTRAHFDESFASASVVGMQLPNHPAAQAIADRIFERRKAYADSVVATWPKRADPPLTIVATVVLVDSLSDPTASAEVRRRSDLEPHEVILLPAGRATLGALRAALQALSDLWVADGLLPVPSTSVTFMVHGEKLMKSTPFLEGAMTSELMGAAQAQKKTVAGIGEVRSFTIAVARRRPAAAKP
jgi:hypothetical protein